MNYNEGYCVRSRQHTLRPCSNRTLHHPSFMPLYMAAGFAHHHTNCNNQTVHPIIPTEFFYTDPTMNCGRRIPNIVSELRVFECFQLNTPPPVMSSCPAPPPRPNPFRSGPHPTRDLGHLTLEINTLHPPVQQGRVVLQLTQEEDQAITNLLKLHHPEEPLQSDFSSINPILFLHPELMDFMSAEEVYKPFCSDVQYPKEASLQQGRCWSDTELEAANTLLSCFGLMEKYKIQNQHHNKSAVALPDPLLHLRHEDSSRSTETQQGSESLPALITADSAQISFSCAREYGEPGWGDFGCVEGRNDDVYLPVSQPESRSGEVREQTLSDSEGDAVHVLLSLGDTGLLDIV